MAHDFLMLSFRAEPSRTEVRLDAPLTSFEDDVRAKRAAAEQIGNVTPFGRTADNSGE